MPGVGTKMVITTNSAAFCLDLTRLISRVGRGNWTGIDRVELEYLRMVLGRDGPAFALVRVRPGFALLDRAGLMQVFERLVGNTGWGTVDLISALSLKAPGAQKQATADMRRLAVETGTLRELGKALNRHVPDGTIYLNVGHSNLTDECFDAVRCVPGAKIVVMVHDTIPLDFPEFQRAETAARFAQKLRVALNRADVIVCPSQSSRKALMAHLEPEARRPELIVAPLGLRKPIAELRAVPEDLRLSVPYFVTLGTIEPRKNHSLLLDIWAEFAEEADAPHLFVIGQRGWLNHDVFTRLDQSPAKITEVNDLSDPAVAAVLAGSHGLLFPSFAEGFGLPALEARALGVPVLCNNLPVFHEVLGNYGIYADVSDMYLWKKQIQKLARGSHNSSGNRQLSNADHPLPTWDSHFNIALSRTC